MIKLIVTDLDGTLLQNNHEVPERFWKIADRLFRQDIRLAIATGRPHYSIVEKFQPILDRLYAISDNGGLINLNQTELLSKPIPSDQLEALIRTARSVPDAWPVLCGKDTWYIENKETVFMEKILLYQKNISMVDDLTRVEDDILKMSLCDIKGAESNSIKYFKPFTDSLKIAVGGTIWLDITRTDANKGEAVRWLQEENNITPDETLVFGDFMNDYEMIQAATYSYAMKNAHPLLLEAANYVTEKDNEEGGVLDVIETLCFSQS